eukprot:Rmarinus@m.8219
MAEEETTEDFFGLDKLIEDEIPREPSPKRRRQEAAPAAPKLDANGALTKLKSHLGDTSSKAAAKFPKASALFCSLVSSHMTVASRDAFFAVACAALRGKDGRPGTILDRVWDDALRRPYGSIIKSIRAKRSILTRDQTEILNSWILRLNGPEHLKTDDTYRFNAELKSLQKELDRMYDPRPPMPAADGTPAPSREGHVPAAAAPDHRAAVFACLASAMSQYRWAWAKVLVERVLDVALAKRRLFLEVDGDVVSESDAVGKERMKQMDEWYASVRKVERQGARQFV